MSDKLVGRLEGKSSLGRLGLIIHTTAGFLDAGNSLKMTLELYNAGKIPLKLYLPVCLSDRWPSNTFQALVSVRMAPRDWIVQG